MKSPIIERAFNTKIWQLSYLKFGLLSSRKIEPEKMCSKTPPTPKHPKRGEPSKNMWVATEAGAKLTQNWKFGCSVGVENNSEQSVMHNKHREIQNKKNREMQNKKNKSIKRAKNRWPTMATAVLLLQKLSKLISLNFSGRYIFEQTELRWRGKGVSLESKWVCWL